MADKLAFRSRKSEAIVSEQRTEQIFRECNLVGNLTRAKLSFGNAIDSAREQGRQEMRELIKEPDYEWD